MRIFTPALFVYSRGLAELSLLLRFFLGIAIPIRHFMGNNCNYILPATIEERPLPAGLEYAHTCKSLFTRKGVEEIQLLKGYIGFHSEMSDFIWQAP